MTSVWFHLSYLQCMLKWKKQALQQHSYHDSIWSCIAMKQNCIYYFIGITVIEENRKYNVDNMEVHIQRLNRTVCIISLILLSLSLFYTPRKRGIEENIKKCQQNNTVLKNLLIKGSQTWLKGNYYSEHLIFEKDNSLD